MKLSKITLACLLATSGVSLSNTASAGITEGFEFGGYVREGLFFSAENDYKSPDGIGQKEMLGRLGLETDNDASINLAKTWDFDNGNAVRISASIDDEADLGVGIELTGVTPSGTLWGGSRGHGKDNYIFMTDFFYTEMSGTGIGVDALEIGDFLVDAAYIASNRDWDDDELAKWEAEDVENFDNYMHTFNLAVTYNSLEASLSYKAMVDNWDEDTLTTGKEYAETGADLTLIYTLDDFFFTGKGQSAIIAQAGYGLGSGNLLGGTINSYNAFAPGSTAQGHRVGEFEQWGIPEKGDAEYLLTHVQEEYTSARLLVWGGYTFENGIALFPSIQAQYNDMDVDGYNYWASAMARAYIPVNNVMFVQTEAGVSHYNWNGGTWGQQKVTIAPTFIMGTGSVTPEIRLFASYIKDAWSVDEGDDVVVGMQAEVSW